MNTKSVIVWVVLPVLAALPLFSSAQKKGLNDYYKDYFLMGVAVSPAALKTDEAALIVKHFGSLTAENAMKMEPIHPGEKRYYWKDADAIVDFARANKMHVRGHTLCWHQQTPSWMFTDSTGAAVTKEILLNRLKEHINTVVSRYKGRVYAWDVVNEVISDDSAAFYRPSLWYTICGEEYIEKAFQWAHEADPEAILFYNDYNTENAVKREKIYRMLTFLKERGVPVHGMGLQGHWSLAHPSQAQLRESLRLFSSLKLDIQITELDVSVYPGDSAPGEVTKGELFPFTKEQEEKQIEQYKRIFAVLREFRNEISAVTFWNISDRHSWLDNYPVRGRKNYPLLFDRDLKPKKVYHEVTRF